MPVPPRRFQPPSSPPVSAGDIDPFQEAAMSVELVKRQAKAIVMLINAGFSHDLVVDAVTSGDLTKLTGSADEVV